MEFHAGLSFVSNAHHASGNKQATAQILIKSLHHF